MGVEQIDNKNDGKIKRKNKNNGAKKARVEANPFDPLERRNVTKIVDRVKTKEETKDKTSV